MLEDAIRRWNPWWAERKVGREFLGITREMLPEILKATKLPHIKDIIGIRRSGKTTAMYQIVSSLLESGLNPESIAFLNFDDAEINIASFEDIAKSLGKISPEIKYLFVDEVQQKKGWERWIRTLYDSKMFAQIFVSGSSSSLLSSVIGRVLTGRHLTFALFPFSFKEYLVFSGWERFDENFLKYNRARILHYQEKYLKGGGFPETIGKKDSERKMVLTNIYNDILSRDIAARFGVSIEGIRRVAYHLLTNIANEFSFRSVAGSAGLSVETAEKYIGYLRESFMVLTVDFFSYKTKVQFRQNKKVYCIDTGLRNAVSFRFSEDIGRLAENLVFIELKRRGKDVYYWKDKTGKELDFLVREGLNAKELIQVCWNVEDKEPGKRESKSLLAAMKEFGLRKGIIITEDKEGEEKINGRKIEYIPLWKWLLLG